MRERATEQERAQRYNVLANGHKYALWSILLMIALSAIRSTCDSCELFNWLLVIVHWPFVTFRDAIATSIGGPEYLMPIAWPATVAYWVLLGLAVCVLTNLTRIIARRRRIEGQVK
jgi:hypothetical protein